VKLTPERLWRRALAYLQRYAATEASLRRVLTRRALREAEAGGPDSAALAAMVDATVARAREQRLVSDLAFAEARVRRLVARGRSPAAIRAALALKGVEEGVVGQALRRVAEEQGDPDLGAAVAFARRRRLGPWRRGSPLPEAAERELAAMARAGFSFRIARRVIDAGSPDELVRQLHGG
jgi:regulatory protein